MSISLALAVSLLLISLASLMTLALEPKLVYAVGSHYVTKDCTDAPLPCYLTLQAAIDAATDGDVIKIATGTYTEVNHYAGQSQLAYLSKTLTIRGGYPPTFAEPANPEAYPTSLDAEGKGRVLYITGEISPIIEGLRISGGDASELMVVEGGGGVFVITATAILSHNFISGNRSNCGGGIFARHSQISLFNNTLVSNTVSEGGGGFSADGSSVILSNNIIISNTTDFWGGGLHFYESMARLEQNTITTNPAQFGGGFFVPSSLAILNDNTIVTNEATYGGGIFTYFSTVALEGTGSV
jgi:hypothetical protein